MNSSSEDIPPLGDGVTRVPKRFRPPPSMENGIVPKPIFTAPPVPGVQYAREIEYTKDGTPMLVARPVIRKQHVDKLLEMAASLPYEDKTGEEPELDGRPCIEVIAVKMAQEAASGNGKMMTEMLDRLIGRPKQHTESVSMKVSLQEYIDSIAEKEGSEEESIFSDM